MRALAGSTELCGVVDGIAGTRDSCSRQCQHRQHSQHGRHGRHFAGQETRVECYRSQRLAVSKVNLPTGYIEAACRQAGHAARRGPAEDAVNYVVVVPAGAYRRNREASCRNRRFPGTRWIGASAEETMPKWQREDKCRGTLPPPTLPTRDVQLTGMSTSQTIAPRRSLSDHDQDHDSRQCSASPASPSIFDNSVLDTSQATTVTEPDAERVVPGILEPAAPIIPLSSRAVPVPPRPVPPQLTREQARQVWTLLSLQAGRPSGEIGLADGRRGAEGGDTLPPTRPR